MANIVPFDDGEWKSYTAVAGVAVSGGTLYRAGSYTNTASSTENYTFTRVIITAIASGQFCAGMALYDRASGTNNEVAILRHGVVLAFADGNVNAGTRVASAHAVAQTLPVVGPATAGRNGDDIIGTALVEAASGNATYLLLNL